MQRGFGVFGRVLLWLTIVGLLAAFVWGVCRLIIRQPELVAPVPGPARLFPYEITAKDGTVQIVYVTRGVHLTSQVSGLVARTCIGMAMASLLVVAWAQTLRLLTSGPAAPADRRLTSITPEGLRYAKAWRDLKLRRSLVATTLVSGLSWGMAAVVFSLSARPFDLRLLLGWLIGSLLLQFWADCVRCPRCAQRYGLRADHSVTYCSHCGLPEGSPPTTAVAPEFVEWKKWN